MNLLINRSFSLNTDAYKNILSYTWKILQAKPITFRQQMLQINFIMDVDIVSQETVPQAMQCETDVVFFLLIEFCYEANFDTLC